MNRATTAAPGGGDAIGIEREHGSNRIAVTGTLAADDELSRDWASVPDPTGYAADVFLRALEDRIAVRLASYSQDGAVAAEQPAIEPPAVRLPADVECSWVKDC